MNTISVVASVDRRVAGRIEGFDLLRGLCSIAVAYYHIFAWVEFAHFLSWGRYGVYIFFVLSGASMYIAYNQKLIRGYALDKFIALRFVRLAPLYILALLGSMIFLFLKDQDIRMLQSFLNVSFLFSIGNPGDTSNVTGGWSIGVEFLFYLIFPVLAAFARSRLWIILLVLSYFSQHAFINVTLSRSSDLAATWVSYTQMLSFIFYFVAGCSIGRLIEEGKIHFSVWWGVVFLALLIPLAAVNNEQNIVGITGMFLSLCAVAIVLASSGLNITGFAAQVSAYMGKMSYGVYILHPFLYAVLKRLMPFLLGSPFLFATLVVICSAVIAILIDRYFETPIQQLAHKHLRKETKYSSTSF